VEDAFAFRRFRGWVVACAALLGACSSVPYARRVAQRQAAYAAAAGAPVHRFHFFTLYSWEPLGERQVVVYARPNQAWLLDVPGCVDLPFTNAIGLTSNIHQVSVGFDKVITGRRNFPCTITRIRPVDVKKLKQAEVQRRTVEEKPRDAADRPATDKTLIVARRNGLSAGTASRPAWRAASPGRSAAGAGNPAA
jgi:hypothetical protein